MCQGVDYMYTLTVNVHGIRWKKLHFVHFCLSRNFREIPLRIHLWSAVLVLILTKLTTFVILICLVSWLTASQSLNFDLFSSLLDCYIILANSLHSIQCLFRPVPISLSLFTLDLDWMHSPTIVLRHVEALSCCNVLIPYLIIWITFKYLFNRFVDISHWLLCNILDEIWSFELIIFKEIHICIFHMSLIGNGNTPKVLIGCLSCPIDSNDPGIQLAMWLGQMKIFRTMLCTLCQNYYYIQYATMWLPLHEKVKYLHYWCHY